MGSFIVDGTSRPGILHLELTGTMTPDEMRRFVVDHNRTIDRFDGRDYRVFCDVAKLRPLDPECAALFEQAKRYSASRPNFRGSAVLVDSATVAMQHRRTSMSGGVMDTELISDDRHALERHLATVHRNTPR